MDAFGPCVPRCFVTLAAISPTCWPILRQVGVQVVQAVQVFHQAMSPMFAQACTGDSTSHRRFLGDCHAKGLLTKHAHTSQAMPFTFLEPLPLETGEKASDCSN